MVIKEQIEKYYEDRLKNTQGRRDVFDRLGAKSFRSRVLKSIMECN